MPFSLLCCYCYPSCVSLSSCFGFFSSDCIPPSLQTPQHLPSSVFIHKGPVFILFFSFKQSYFADFFFLSFPQSCHASVLRHHPLFMILQNFIVFLYTDTPKSQVSAQAVVLQLWYESRVNHINFNKIK